MTKQKINQIYFINKEIEMWKRELAELRESELQSPQLDGIPHGNAVSDITGNKASKIADIENIINELLLRAQIARKEIYSYINKQDDSLVRQIIMYRCLSLCSWDEVAIYIGGNNTAESVRKIFDRHFGKNIG